MRRVCGLILLLPFLGHHPTFGQGCYWLDFSGWDDDTVRSAAGQDFAVPIPQIGLLFVGYEDLTVNVQAAGDFSFPTSVGPVETNVADGFPGRPSTPILLGHREPGKHRLRFRFSGYPTHPGPELCVQNNSLDTLETFVVAAIGEEGFWKRSRLDPIMTDFGSGKQYQGRGVGPLASRFVTPTDESYLLTVIYEGLRPDKFERIRVGVRGPRINLTIPEPASCNLLWGLALTGLWGVRRTQLPL